MAGYRSSVRKDIERWREAGLIDDVTARALTADVEARRWSGVSFGTVLAILAAILVAAALLLLIAANWEAFPRLARVALVFAVILGGYGGGAVLMKRGHNAFAEALWLLAAVGFGGGIALIGQMYHLSGNEADALLLWTTGTMLAAAALRSSPLTAGAVLLAAAWMIHLAVESGQGGGVPPGYPLLALLLWSITIWTGSVSARHLILLSLMLFAGLFYLDRDVQWAPLLLAAVSAGLFALGAMQTELAEQIFGLGKGLAIQGLLGFVAGMSIIQAEHHDGPYFMPIALALFAGIVAALLMAGRDNRPLRWAAYAGFVCELGFVYIVLLGSMLNTSGLFLAAGLVLSLLAWLVSRIERRMAAAHAVNTGAGA